MPSSGSGMIVGAPLARSPRIRRNSLHQRTVEHGETAGAILRRIEVFRDRSGRFRLPQPVGEVTVSLEDALERFPCIDHTVRVAITPAIWNIRRNSRVGAPNCVPIAEVPSLQFLNHDPVGQLPALFPRYRAKP